MSMDSSFAPLHLQSDGSFLRGAIGPLDAAREARLRAGRSDFPLALRGVRAGRASGRPVVATGEALVLEPAQRELRRALAAMREKRLVARVPLEREAPAHARLLSPGEAAAEFAD